jgi:bifunctional UDP-N-acetylglucosamine pyrophosphorylase/glucosamine-1-phosphate N-acetyltransferase
VRIGQDTVLYPHVALEGHTSLGEDCVIRSHTRVANTTVGNGVVIQDSCVITDAQLEDSVSVGPFAHLRPGSIVRRKAKVGNFVEMKKAELGEGAKANHLSYLGDARIGKNVNIGAGTITCNYDGYHKFETVIEDEVFIGSDTQLVAPVKVGRGSVIAAGTTITQDVPPDSLAISRTVQANRVGWASKRRGLLNDNGPHGSSGDNQATNAISPNVNRTAPQVKQKGKPPSLRRSSRASVNRRTKKG